MTPLLTSREVAEILRVSEATLSRWRAARSGPAFVNLSPGMPRYRADDVARWVEGNTA